MSRTTRDCFIDGFVARGFESVRDEFVRNFQMRGEVGGAVAAWVGAEKVVDLWGGFRNPERTARWLEHTVVPVASTTKGMAATTLAMQRARGLLDYDERVAHYWPEFAQHGKESITVRQLLGHEAGLVVLDEPLSIERMHDLDDVARVLARQKPAWPPGSRHGYHAMTLGFYMQELMRRIDPQHRTIGRFFADEVARPLDVEFHIGLPASVPESRIAKLVPFSPTRAVAALGQAPIGFIEKVLWPWSMLRKSLAIPEGWDANERDSLAIELPAGNGVGTARALACVYAALARGGDALGIDAATFAQITASPRVERPIDEVLGIPSWFSLGYLRPGPDLGFGTSARALGAPGAGGSFAFADPDTGVGYAYVMNKLDYHLFDDPREKSLRDALFRAVR